MILAIDAGNTRIKWGLHDRHDWQATHSIPTLDAARLQLPAAERAIASNVAGPEVEAQLKKLCPELRIIRSEKLRLGVVNHYREPSQLGSDRWAALIAAHHSRRGHKLVVNAGTALTIDALAGDGRFLGGLIVPGPGLMRRSLDHGTAGLRLTEGDFASLPRSTPDAITTGSIQACIGAVMRMRDAMAAQGVSPEIAVLSGGASAQLSPHLPFEYAIHDNLVLDGLVLIARGD